LWSSYDKNFVFKGANYTCVGTNYTCVGTTFAQLGVITAREQTTKTGQESSSERPTGYHLAVNLDDEYRPAAVWFLSTTPAKSARNTYKSPSGQQMPRFAAAQIASSLGEMNKIYASELKFVNIQEEYTIMSDV
jgi:hypothetical protein